MLGLCLLIIFTNVVDTQGFSAMDALTVEQRMRIFGTNTSDNLPPIKLVTLQRLDVGNIRPFRKRPANVLRYRLTMNGQEIVLTLKQDIDFPSPGCFVHRHWKNSTKDMYPCARDSSHCFFTGHSETDRDVWIAANACQGLKGLLMVWNTSYVIAPLHSTDVGSHGNDTNIHVIYRYVSDKRVCQTPEPPQLPGLHIVHRGKRAIRQTKYIETRVVVDPSMYEFHQHDSEDYVLTLFSIASRAYEERSIGDDIKLILTEIHIFDSYNEIGLELTVDANKTLTDFCKWIASNMTATKPDCNVLLTRLDIEMNGDNMPVGLAEPSAMCQTGSNCVIVEDLGPVSGSVIAHEIGHLLGMEHDEDTECGDVTGIMTSVVTGGNQYTWTNCSAKALHTFLRKPSAICLFDEPKGITKMIGINRGRQLPGTLFTRDQQCKLLLGKQATYCKDITEQRMSSLCRSMVCKKTSDEKCDEYSTQFADGTDCNNTRTWCIAGESVAMDTNSSTLPINGYWADWDAEFSRCTRTCGGGVKLMRRTCTNPPPQFGGQFCLGESIRAVMCNMQHCKNNFKDTQCSTLDDQNSTWVPLDISTGNDSCLFKCITIGSNATRLKSTTSPYIDGTECSLGGSVAFGRCIDGQCRAFGCDGYMDSGMVYDKCGICNGTGSECQKISGNYSTPSKDGHFITVQVIPSGSFGVKIRQFSKYSFLSIVVNGKRVFNKNPRHRPSGTYVVDDVTIKYNSLPESVAMRGVTAHFTVIQVYNFYERIPPQVHYEYYRPLDTRIMEYTWATREMGCSKSCGTGTMATKVQCVDFSGPVDDYLCDLSKKPSELHKPCNDFYCPPEWKTSDFSPCSRTCGLGGTRVRKVHCVRERNGTETIVPSAVCHNLDAERPSNIVNCTITPCWGVWKSGIWSQCSKTCGRGYQLRTSKCFKDMNSTTSINKKYCKLPRPVDMQECFMNYCYKNYSCTDEITNCRSYGNNVCYGQYHLWAERTCTKFCDICTVVDDPSCSGYAAVGIDVCADYPGWSKLHCPLYCQNKDCTDSPQCRDMAQFGDICQNVAFALKNCPKMCKVCSKGECVDKQVCSGYNKVLCTEPKYAPTMKIDCPKFCGFC